MTKLLLSARWYKGHLTRQINTITRAKEAFERRPTEFAAQELLEAIKMAQRTMDNLLTKMQKPIEGSSSTEDFEVHESDLDSYFERSMQTKENTMDAINASKIKMPSHLNPASPSKHILMQQMQALHMHT